MKEWLETMKWHERLKRAREYSDISLRELSKEIGVSNSYLSQLENGKIKNPSFIVIMQLCSLYEIYPEDIFDLMVD